MATTSSLSIPRLVLPAIAPASPRPLAAFRIGFTLVLMAQALVVAPALLETHGSQGILQGTLMESQSGHLPSLTWVTTHLAEYGIAEAMAIRTLFAAYLAGLGGLLLGWRTRVLGVIAWGAHLLLFPGWHLSSYGVDQFATIALFYMVVMPVGHALSLDAAAGRVSSEPSTAARVALTVLRVHLCCVYFASGLDKFAGEQWRNGEAIWRAVMQPQFAQVDLSWMAQVPWVAKLLCWGTLVVELGYAVFVWPRATRRLWVVMTLGLHVGIALFLGIWLFAAAMMALTFAAFGVSPSAKTS